MATQLDALGELASWVTLGYPLDRVWDFLIFCVRHPSKRTSCNGVDSSFSCSSSQANMTIVVDANCRVYSFYSFLVTNQDNN